MHLSSCCCIKGQAAFLNDGDGSNLGALEAEAADGAEDIILVVLLKIAHITCKYE